MRTLAEPSFPDDDGAADPALAAALRDFDADPEAGYLPALARLAAARLLVPVTAVLAEAEQGADGLTREKSSDMAAVLLRRPDGRTGLLAFTSTETLAAWDADARPVGVSAATAARSARQDGAVALVVDVAGPVSLVVEGDDLDALARGWWPVRLADGGWGWARPAGEEPSPTPGPPG